MTATATDTVPASGDTGRSSPVSSAGALVVAAVVGGVVAFAGLG